jgi:hypothetical protein
MKTKQAFVYGIFAVILALVFAACGDGDGGGGGGDNPGDKNPTTPPGTTENPVGTVYLGETLTLTGQVYEWDYDNYSFRRYNGSGTVEAGYDDYDNQTHTSNTFPLGGSGAITNGQLNFTIGKPDYIKNLGPEDLLVNDIWESYTNIQASKPNVRGIELYLDAFFDWGIYSAYGVGKRNFQYSETGNSYSEIEELVSYIYVEEDITVSGKGKTRTWTTYEYNNKNNIYTHTTKDFTLALKKGWNAVYYLGEAKGTFSGRDEYGDRTNINETWTITVFLSNPALRWVAGVGDGGSSGS